LSALTRTLVVDPVTQLTGNPEAGERAGLLAGLLIPGPRLTGATREALAPGAVATTSRMGRAAVADDAKLTSAATKSYNEPVTPLRPFEEDYPAGEWPNGPPADATRRLTQDIEERPLTAPLITGRRYVGEPNRALSPAQIESVATRLTGKPPEGVPLSEFPPEAYGGYWVERRFPDPSEKTIQYPTDVGEGERRRTIAHETGHAIEHAIVGDDAWHRLGGLNHVDDEADLRRIYNDLHNPDRNQVGAKAYNGPNQPLPPNIVSPETHGYVGHEIGRELFATALRAYMRAPNYIKSVAPRLAAALRATVNEHPTLSKIIQFNAIPLAVGAVASGAGGSDAKAAGAPAGAGTPATQDAPSWLNRSGMLDDTSAILGSGQPPVRWRD
jgi:hypothetical protein